MRRRSARSGWSRRPLTQRPPSVPRLEDVTVHNDSLEERLRALTQSSLSEEERAAQMDRVLSEEELAMKVGKPDEDDFLSSDSPFASC